MPNSHDKYIITTYSATTVKSKVYFCAYITSKLFFIKQVTGSIKKACVTQSPAPF